MAHITVQVTGWLGLKWDHQVPDFFHHLALPSNMLTLSLRKDHVVQGGCHWSSTVHWEDAKFHGISLALIRPYNHSLGIQCFDWFSSGLTQNNIGSTDGNGSLEGNWNIITIQWMDISILLSWQSIHSSGRQLPVISSSFLLGNCTAYKQNKKKGLWWLTET